MLENSDPVVAWKHQGVDAHPVLLSVKVLVITSGETCQADLMWLFWPFLSHGHALNQQ